MRSETPWRNSAYDWATTIIASADAMDSQLRIGRNTQGNRDGLTLSGSCMVTTTFGPFGRTPSIGTSTSKYPFVGNWK